ncbi:MAG: glycosyltransferase [Deltaproteobacteria bacterium]|nr:glycosyltransferase [Deltaproteobacteria bacterium]
MSREPTLSLVVPWNGVGSTEPLLASVANEQDLEVVLVLDGGVGEAPPPMGAHPGRLLALPRRSGPAAARNAGARAASGRLLFFTDADCVLEPGTLEAARSALEKAPIVAGETATLARTTFGRLVGLLGFPGGGTLGFERVWRVASDGTTGSFSGCNVAMRREAFEALGGFDETFPFAGGEDTALAKKAVARSVTIRFERRQRVCHEERSGLAAFVRWQFVRGRGTFHLLRTLVRVSGRPRVATLGPFLRLRLWSLGNGLRAAGALSPFVIALFALLTASVALGYAYEGLRGRT